MPVGELFDEPSGTREALMQATYRALCEHGYADLTIQRISDKFPKSTSLLYHHYDGKDDLLIDFLSFMLDHFETSVPREDYEDAADHLTALLDHILPTELETERAQFMRAMIELRAQAASDPEYRAHFTRSTRFFHGRFVRIIERGVEEGTFREVDPDRVASLLLATIEGAMLQRVTIDEAHTRESISAVRSELDGYLRYRLLAADGEAR